MKNEEKEINETYATIVKMGIRTRTRKPYVHSNKERDFKNERTMSVKH